MVNMTRIQTSWRRKVARAVAMAGSPIRRYQSTHCRSIQLREERSVPAYSSCAEYLLKIEEEAEVALRDMTEGGEGDSVETLGDNSPSCTHHTLKKNRTTLFGDRQ